MKNNFITKIIFTALLGAVSLSLLAQNKDVSRERESVVVAKLQDTAFVAHESLELCLVSEKKSFASLSFGYSYRLGEAAPGMSNEDVDRMRPGLMAGFDYLYFKKPRFGYGLKVSGHYYSSEVNTGLMKNVDVKVLMIYVAPTLAWRYFDKQNKNAFVLGASFGYVHYNENVKYYTPTEPISAGGFGAILDLGYDIRLKKENFLSLKVVLVGGSVDANAFGKSVTVSTSSLNFAIGYRF